MSVKIKYGEFDCEQYEGTGHGEACILFVNMVEHPFALDDVVSGLCADVLSVTMPHWDDSLTPWVAPGLYPGDPDFGGDAANTLEAIENDVVSMLCAGDGKPYAKVAIAGYSLGGLFSLYAFVNASRFCAAASMSGSVWYEGWLQYLEDSKRDLQGSFAYLSIGETENRARQKILHGVIRDTEETAGILHAKGAEVEFQKTQGSHYENVPEKISLGLHALDAALSEEGTRLS